MADFAIKYSKLFTDKSNLLPRRRTAHEIIRNGQKMGQFREDLDLDLIVDLYAGPIYFRAFSRYANMDETFAKGLADHVLQTILRPTPAPRVESNDG